MALSVTSLGREDNHGSVLMGPLGVLAGGISSEVLLGGRGQRGILTHPQHRHKHLRSLVYSL